LNKYLLNVSLPFFVLLANCPSSYGQLAQPAQPQMKAESKTDTKALEDLRKRGLALIKGQGIARNVEEGVKLLALAAQKDMSAKITLGNLLVAGTDVPRDMARGLALLEEGAVAKIPGALLGLAGVYQNGTGVAADPVKARDYFDRAVATGDVGAQRRLGEVLVKGQGLPRDVVVGMQLLEAAAQKDVYGKITLGNLLVAGTDVPRDMTRGLALLEEGAVAKIPGALLGLAGVYQNGTGVAADPVKARDYFDRAVATGDVGAQRRLGEVLVKGQGLPRDVVGGTKLLDMAAAKDVTSQIAYASLLLRGEFLPQDTARGRQMLETAGASGAIAAFDVLGNFVLDTLPKSQKEGVAYLERAAKGGNQNSWLSLARRTATQQIKIKTKGFAFYAQKAREAKLPGIEIVDAERYIKNLGVPVNAKRYFAIMETAAQNGNADAVRGMARTYRNGIYKVVPKSLKKSAAVVARYKDKLTLDQLKVEEMLFAAAQLPSAKAFAGFDARWEKTGLLDRPELAWDIYSANRNFSVYRAQRAMKAQGAYRGPVNGLLTARTIAAINKVCPTVLAKAVCSKNLLAANVLSAIAKSAH
jgi:TPR repeat protein